MISWFVSKIKLIGLKGSRRRLELATSRCRQLLGQLEIKRKKLKSLERKVVVLSESLLEDLEEAEKSLKRMEAALETEREKVRLYEDVTVPGLMAAHQAVVARIEAEHAVSVRNRTLAQITHGEE